MTQVHLKQQYQATQPILLGDQYVPSLHGDYDAPETEIDSFRPQERATPSEKTHKVASKVVDDKIIEGSDKPSSRSHNYQPAPHTKRSDMIIKVKPSQVTVVKPSSRKST